MWSTIANLKENLNKIALDVHHADDEEDDVVIPSYGIPTADENPAVSDRRNSHGFTHSKSVPRSPAANGITDHPYASEIEQYKAEIKRLQASEAEIKALSVNYAALLKEKEESSNQSSNRQHRFTTQMKNRYAINNGTMSTLDSDAMQSKMVSSHSNLQAKDKMCECLLGASRLGRRQNSPTAAVQHTYEIQKLKLELEQERDKLANIQLKFQEEQKLNKSFQEELKLLKLERDKVS